MIRIVLFLLGCALMAISLFIPFLATDDRLTRFRLFDLGLLLAVGAHGWPEGLR